ncbi:hypothetical protein [Dysgonomonas sp.]
MSLALLVMISCNIGFTFGFKFANNFPDKETIQTTFREDRIKYIILLFASIGLVATFMNRGIYKGGFVSGTFVIIQFFANYLDYLFILLLICIRRKLKVSKLVYLLLGVIILVQIDKFLISARRGEAIQFFLALSFFFFYNREKLYHRFKWIIPAFFLVGVLLNSQIGEYRENAYSGKVSASENIQDLEFSFSNPRTSLNGLEINNAIIGINSCYENGAYDYGGGTWNGIVNAFVPKVLVGEAFKASLVIPSDNRNVVRSLTKSGSTMTGYFDSFTSFGVFCWIKFAIIGFILGLLWLRSNRSVIALTLYVAMMSPSLHVITHSTDRFFSNMTFYFVFIYIFIYACVYKTETLNNE